MWLRNMIIDYTNFGKSLCLIGYIHIILNMFEDNLKIIIKYEKFKI